MKWRWLLGGALVLVGGSCGALMTGAHFEAADHYDRQAAALKAAITKHDDAFRADQRVASSLAVLDVARSAKRDGKDAGPLLVAHGLRVRAQDGAIKDVPPKIAKAVSEVALTKFPERALDADVSGVDLAWMRDLSSFDHWELLDVRPVSFHQMGLPDARSLDTIARIRLLQGVASGDVKSAGADVENLTRLVASTENLVVARDAVPRLMSLVRQTFEHARSEGLDVTGWTPPDRPTIDAVRRGLRAYGGYADYHVDPAQLGDLFTSASTAAGRCAGLNDVATTLLEIGPITGARYEAALPWVGRALEDTRETCRLVLVREAWGDPKQRALVVGSDSLCDPEADPGGCVFVALTSSFPGIRDMEIEMFTSDAADALASYETKR